MFDLIVDKLPDCNPLLGEVIANDAKFLIRNQQPILKSPFSWREKLLVKRLLSLVLILSFAQTTYIFPPSSTF